MGIVDREAFEASVQRATSACDRPLHGLHGPDSASWRIARESVLFLGGGCAALLQLAHPYVAHAVDQHSATRKDPIGRFNRTFRHVYAMVFGQLDAAVGSAHRVRAIHDRIGGTIDERVGRFEPGHRYEANDAGALLWVHATLIHTAVSVYDRAISPLPYEVKDAYWRESKHFARLFGVPDELLPEDWSAFESYWEDMLASDTIAVGRPAREIAGFLLTPPNRRSVALMRWYRLMTAGLLPSSLREPFGLRFEKRERLLFGASMRAVRSGYAALPRRLRDVPAYVEACRRLEGKEGPDRFGRTIERLVLKTIEP